MGSSGNDDLDLAIVHKTNDGKFMIFCPGGRRTPWECGFSVNLADLRQKVQFSAHFHMFLRVFRRFSGFLMKIFTFSGGERDFDGKSAWGPGFLRKFTIFRGRGLIGGRESGVGRCRRLISPLPRRMVRLRWWIGGSGTADGRWLHNFLRRDFLHARGYWEALEGPTGSNGNLTTGERKPYIR